MTSSTWTKDLAPHKSDVNFYDVDIVYDAAGNITSTVDNVLQLPGGTRRFDAKYGLDSLGRLLGVERGHLASGSLSDRQEHRTWTLTQTGNWDDRLIDYDGDGVLTDSYSGASPPIPPDLEFSSTTYNVANEWTGRTEVTGNTPPGSPATVPTPYTMTYDDAGNMTSDGKEYNYTYDVFGRLVGIDTVSIDDPVKSYRYNGLGWRITDSDGIDTEHLVYNERWQLVATYDGADVREQFVHHAAGLDGHGGSSYIDSVILRTTYTGNGQSLVEDERFYYAQNWRADVSVILDDAGVQRERVIYSPYGQPFAMPAGDTNFDGDFEAGVDGNELAAWSGDGKPYRAYGDVDLDGDVDGDDANAASEHDLGWNVLTSSDVNNRLGQVGVIYDEELADLVHGRQTSYSVSGGRALTRGGDFTAVPDQACYLPCGCGGSSGGSPGGGGGSGGPGGDGPAGASYGLACLPSPGPPSCGPADKAIVQVYNSLVQRYGERAAACMLARMYGVEIAACISGFDKVALATMMAAGVCSSISIIREPPANPRPSLPERIRKRGCEAMKAWKHQVCKGKGSHLRACPKQEIKRLTANCECSELLVRSLNASNCAAARLAEMMWCDFGPNPKYPWRKAPGQGDPGHWTQYHQQLRRAAKCWAGYQQCMATCHRPTTGPGAGFGGAASGAD